jgi:DNA-binding Lrp family transcriptional regulator
MIKKKDLMILYYLRKNARESLTNISKSTRIPISTIYEKLRASKGKLIIKHTSLINFGMIGFNARANILLKGAKTSRKDLYQYLYYNENVNSMYKINNGYDYLLECIFSDMKELEDFVDLMDEKFGLERKDVYYIIDDIKREMFLSDPKLSYFSS